MFQTENLRVRKLADNDVDYLVKWLSDPLVLQYYGGRDRPHDIEMVKEIFFPQEDSECNGPADLERAGHFVL
ncbi:hypothetical protein GCM10020370_30750 [Paenibacillus hodogayensis]